MPVPDDLVEWADDATFDAGPALGADTKVEPPVGVAEQGLVPGYPLGSQHLNYTLNNIVQWLHWFRGTGGDGAVGWFGDASDGNVTIGAGTTTLTRDMFYGDLDIEAGGILETAGFRIFVTGTLGNEGTITAAGADGSNGSGGTGGAGGAGYSDGTIAGSSAGGAGGNALNNGSNGPGLTDSFGGDGGNGGDTTSYNGGSGGFAAQSAGPPRHASQVILGQALPGSGATPVMAVGGTGGGGGAAEAISSSGGGGGAGGGAIVIAAWALVNTGTITADGGDGGDASSAASGGGGGGGGWIGIVTHLGVSGAGTITANGGAGGVGHASQNDGDAGDDGTIVQLII